MPKARMTVLEGNSTCHFSDEMAEARRDKESACLRTRSARGQYCHQAPSVGDLDRSSVTSEGMKEGSEI